MKRRAILYGIMLLIMCMILTACEKKDILGIIGEKTNTISNETQEEIIENAIKENNIIENTVAEIEEVEGEEIELISNDSQIVYKNQDNVYTVYTYSGEYITGLYTYVDCETVGGAEKALVEAESEPDPSIERMFVKGKYLVFEVKDNDFKDVKVNDLKRAMSFLKEIKK